MCSSDLLTTANKQATQWLHAVKAGRPYDGEPMIQLAGEAMEHFVQAQKKFLDVIAVETSHATGGKPIKTAKTKKAELSELAHEAANAYLEAQKKLLDVTGRQMNVNLQVAGRALKVLKPFRLPLASLTGEGVKTFVDAEKALIDNMMKRTRATPAPRPKSRRKPARSSKPATHRPTPVGA